MTAPLAGVKVLELARILAGPWGGQTLADLGADVIKVESPAGDDTRHWGPPFVTDTDGGALSAAYFYACNRGKRSIVADFSRAEDLERVRALAAEADVVIENFKVGGLARYGLDHAALSASNPRLVYASITGFGQDGPYAARAGYDVLVQAMGGAMSITGEPGGPPLKAGYATADLFTGLYATIGILAALRRRDATGVGAYIDCALLDSQVAVLGNQALSYLVTGSAPGRLGNAHPSIVPYELFPAADGHVIIAVGNDGQFRRLAAALGDDDLADDPRFTSNAMRVANRGVLVDRLAARTCTLSRAALVGLLEAATVPGGPINGIDDVFADPQVQHRGMRIDLPAPHVANGTVPGVRTPIMIDGVPMAHAAPPPLLGADAAAGWRNA